MQDVYKRQITDFVNWVSMFMDAFTGLQGCSNQISAVREFIELPEPFRFEDGDPLLATGDSRYEITPVSYTHLLFDVNTPYKFKTVYGENHYVLEDDRVLIAWRNQFDEASGLCDFALDVFTENDQGAYNRQSESHQERCYTADQLRQAAVGAGLMVEGIYSDFNHTPYTKDESCERWYFVLRKPADVEKERN